ncbi:MAG: hypothetical protein MUF50_03660 [Planctomycetes bacterium]|jgi:hypothetical protein|nr:hypothetical protein [Planctomycetota bacterium]
MSHEIESEFVADWEDENSQCCNCTSFAVEDGNCFCTESQTEVPPCGHCNFFQSID